VTDPRAHWPASLAGHGDVRDRLLAAYADPRRAYHDVRHLAEVLDRVEEMLPTAPGVDADAVRLAAWFHDAVYDEGGDLEDRSAVLARKELDRIGVPTHTVEEVARLVRLTAHHRPLTGDTAGEVLCDADLAILAADEARYEEYVRGVRREYAHVPDKEFRAGRAAVLRALTEAPTLFRTEHGRAHWERPGRANVERELRELER
jgi:predicted metal-dependent HD superfamily phosphohydrolase